jgi:hypothetical protein
VKFLWGAKDGGVKSRVWIWGIESKRFGSIGLVKFAHGSRDAFHSHAFNAVSWVLLGRLEEIVRHGDEWDGGHDWIYYGPSLRPIYTPRERFHMVRGLARSTWVLTFRGPWVDTWREYLPTEDRYVTLTHGRKEIP